VCLFGERHATAAASESTRRCTKATRMEDSMLGRDVQNDDYHNTVSHTIFPGVQAQRVWPGQPGVNSPLSMAGLHRPGS